MMFAIFCKYKYEVAQIQKHDRRSITEQKLTKEHRHRQNLTSSTLPTVRRRDKYKGKIAQIHTDTQIHSYKTACPGAVLLEEQCLPTAIFANILFLINIALTCTAMAEEW